MDLREGRYILPSTPATQVFFDKATPTTGGVIFDPNTPALADTLYVSSLNGSTWIYQDGTYITYTAPVVNNTEWYITGTTIDAGGNKTTSITRNGVVFLDTNQTGFGMTVYNNKNSGASNGLLITRGGSSSGGYGLQVLKGSTNQLRVNNDGSLLINDAYTLPSTDGTADYVLKTNGAGVLSWGAGSSSGKVGIKNTSGVYTYYTTLSAAMTAATSGQTVDLLTDITETGSVTITTKTGVKINGNGYTYTLNVNDATNAITQGSSLIEMSNIKVVRTGRANNASGVVIYKNDTGNLCTLKCQNVVFENTYGVGALFYYSAIYGLTVNSYGNGIDTGNSAGNIYNCTVTSTAGIGIYNNDTSEIANCNVTGATSGISSTFGYVYNTRAVGSSVAGISATRVVNSTGISSTGTGVITNNGYNCVGISTSSVGLSGGFTNSTGISTSGYGGSGTFNTCTLISSSNYALQSGGAVYLYNSLAQSTSSPVTARANIYNSTVRCLWNNASGSCTNSFVVGSHEVMNSFLEVSNASAYCITGYVGSTWKFAGNAYKGATTAVNSTNITQGITNTKDNQGNILI